MQVLQDPSSRSARISHDSKTHIPADKEIKPLRDQIIVEPLNVVLSDVIITHEDTKPLRGIVKAVGPGHYPKVYDHPDKHRRTKMWDSEVFEPVQVRVGDVVELGGYGHQGYSFQTFFWGDVEHLICREMDVSGVVDGLTAERAREECAHATI
jgi:co-chaperonin GroES (HSP10)